MSGRFQLTYFGEGSGKMNDSDPSINRDGYDPRSRGWYQEAMAKGGMIVTKPYLDVAYNVMVVTLAQPAQGGVVGGDLHRLPGGGCHQDGPAGGRCRHPDAQGRHRHRL